MYMLRSTSVQAWVWACFLSSCLYPRHLCAAVSVLNFFVFLEQQRCLFLCSLHVRYNMHDEKVLEDVLERICMLSYIKCGMIGGFSTKAADPYCEILMLHLIHKDSFFVYQGQHT